MHVGNLRTALYAYLAAKAGGADGTFILRVEDTDQERFVEGAMDVIFNTLRETGLVWDEGPDVGGAFGPYIQSERKEIYKEHVDRLIESGHAYYCFCDKERLESVRTLQRASGTPPRYDRHCLSLSKEEIAQSWPRACRTSCVSASPTRGPSRFATRCTAPSPSNAPRSTTRCSSRPTACRRITSPTLSTTT
jgi:glutamyl-tRNA synthetase